MNEIDEKRFAALEVRVSELEPKPPSLCPKCGGKRIEGIMLLSCPPQVKCSVCGSTWVP